MELMRNEYVPRSSLTQLQDEHEHELDELKKRHKRELRMPLDILRKYAVIIDKPAGKDLVSELPNNAAENGDDVVARHKGGQNPMH